MKAFIWFALGLLILSLSIILMMVAYLLFNEVRDEWELNKKLRQTERSE